MADDKPGPDILRELDDFQEDPGLCSMRSLDIFVNWYVWGGMNRGLSLSEIIDMPSWLLQDFKYLMRKYSNIKAEKESFKKLVRDAQEPQNR